MSRALLALALLAGCEFCDRMPPEYEGQCLANFGCDANFDGVQDDPIHCEPSAN
jgi:hypothetical protein